MNSNSPYLPIVIHPWNSLGDKKLVNGLDGFFQKMDGNKDFVSIADTVAAFGISTAAFSKQVTVAANRDRDAVAKKNTMRTSIITDATALGVAVQQIAGTNLEQLIGSGAPLRKARQSVVLQPPLLFDVTLGNNAGELFIKTSTVYGGLVYNVKYALDPIGEKVTWQFVSSSTSQCTITGLQSNCRYWVFVEIVGSKKQTVSTKMILSPIVQ